MAILVGTALDDILEGTTAADTINGLGGSDVLYGLEGDDVLFGGGGPDSLRGNEGNDTLDGGSGDDGLIGAAGNDSLTAGDGDDNLGGDEGDDTLNGGAGFDIAYYNEAPSAVSVNLAAGTATGGGGSDTLFGIEGVHGSVFGDTLISGANADVLEGLGGDDVLIGGGGGDSLRGDEGDDTLDGGSGDDGLIGGDGLDVALYTGVRAAHVIGGTAPELTVVGPEGTDALVEIERLQFADRGIAFDLGTDESAGNTVRVIGAAFGAPFIIPLYVGVGLQFFDGGMTLPDVCELVAQQVLGLDNATFVTRVFTNVVGFAPDPVTRDAFVGMLIGSGGQATQGELLTLAAASEFTADRINLVGLQQTGVEFV